MTANVRRALPEDARDVSLIELACSRHPWTEQQLREEIEFPQAYTCVLEADGRAAGFATMQIAAEFAHINELGVLPEFRRNGFGRLIMTDLIREARSRGCEQMFLEVRQSNVPARNLYGSFGFGHAGTRKRFYREPEEDALVLILDLKEDKD